MPASKLLQIHKREERGTCCSAGGAPQQRPEAVQMGLHRAVLDVQNCSCQRHRRGGCFHCCTNETAM